MKFSILLLFAGLVFGQEQYETFEKENFQEELLQNKVDAENLRKLEIKYFSFVDMETKKCSAIKGKSKSRKKRRKDCRINLIQFQKNGIAFIYKLKYKLTVSEHSRELESLTKSKDELLLELNRSLSRLVK